MELTQIVEHRYDYGTGVDLLILVTTIFVVSVGYSLTRYLWWLMEDTEES